MWKQVKGYEGLYEASIDGQIRNFKTKKVLNPYGFKTKARGSEGYRYYKVKLYKDGGKSCKTHILHRLIAMTHIENPDNKPEVNHIDGNRTNNASSNLEWVTRKENLEHAVKLGLIDITKMTDVTKKKVQQLDMDGNLIKTWGSLSEAARGLNLQIANISHCCSGRIKSTGGYKWSRLER